jgi:hypothetical protein
MRKGFFAAVGAIVLGGTAVFAQTPPLPVPDKGALSPPLPALPAEGPSSAVVSSALCASPAAESDSWAGAGRMTFSADYLLWWVRKGPTPGPLLTSGSVNDPIPGALGQPNTVSLFGDGGLNYQKFAGLRLGGSVGLTPDFAVDGSYFALERRSTSVSAASDSAGSPQIARPFINDFNGLQESYSVSFPGAFSGAADIVSHTRLQGFEVNLAANLMRSQKGSLDVLVGYRYLDLREDLLYYETLTPLGPGDLTFQGAPINPTSSLADFDGFRTRNHFNGGQIGARWQQSFGNLEVGVTGKLALGSTSQHVDIDGSSTLVTPEAAPTTVASGIPALPTNIGSYSHNEFSVVPEVGVNLGWRFTDNLSAHVGYTFLYWTHVVRPGAEIDPRLNPLLVPTDQAFGLAGPPSAHPVFGFHSSDFWAQGLNFGLTLRF